MANWNIHSELDCNYFTWRIPGVSSIPHVVGYAVQSPPFVFGGTTWTMKMYPNGESQQNEGHISVTIERSNTQGRVDCYLYYKDNSNKEIFLDATYIQNSEKKVSFPRLMRNLNESSQDPKIVIDDTLYLVLDLRLYKASSNECSSPTKSAAETVGTTDINENVVGEIFKKYEERKDVRYIVFDIPRGLSSDYNTESPRFSFLNAKWIFKIWPYYRMQNSQNRDVGIVLERLESEVPVHHVELRIGFWTPEIPSKKKSISFAPSQTQSTEFTFQLEEPNVTILVFDIELRVLKSARVLLEPENKSVEEAPAGLVLATTVLPHFWVQCVSALRFLSFGMKMLTEAGLVLVTTVIPHIWVLFVSALRFIIFGMKMLREAGLFLVTTVLPHFWVQCVSALWFLIFGMKMLREGTVSASNNEDISSSEEYITSKEDRTSSSELSSDEEDSRRKILSSKFKGTLSAHNNEAITSSESEHSSDEEDSGRKVLSSKFKVLNALPKKVKQFYSKKELCDVTLDVNGTEFKAHRVILAAGSPVLASMFDHEMSERQSIYINVSDFDPEPFKFFLDYLYNGKVESVSFQNAIHLYRIADYYSVPDLKRLVVEQIEHNLEVENILDSVILAEEYDDKELYAASQDFFNRNVRSILDTAQWKDFLKNYSDLANKLLIQMTSSITVNETS